MRVSTVIALALVAAVLSAYLLLDRLESPTSGRPEGRLIDGFDADQVERIRIEAGQRPPIVLQRAGRARRWQLSAPIVAPADPAAVDRILAALEFLRVSRGVPDQLDPRQLGLDPARIRLVVRRRRGEPPLTLELGTTDISGTGQYLRYKGQLVVVETELYQRLDVDLDQLRERELVPFSAARITRWEAVSAQETLRLERRDANWIVDTKPGWLRASPKAVEQLLGAASGLQARRFLQRIGAATSSGSERRLRVSAGTDVVALRVGGDCVGHEGEKAVVRERKGDPALYACVDREDLARLWPSRREVFDRQLTRARPTDLARLDIRAAEGQGGLELERDGTRWRMRSALQRTTARLSTAKEADGDAVRTWVERLSGVRGTVEPVAKDSGLRRYQLGRAGRVDLHPEVGPVEVLRFGPSTARGVPVGRGGEAAVFWAPPQVIEQLAVGEIDFRPRRVLELEPHEIQRIRTVRAGPGGFEEIVQRADEAWRVVRPVKVAADDELMTKIVGRLAGLRARRFIDEARWSQIDGESFSVHCELVVQDLTPVGAKRRREVELDIRRDAGGTCWGRVVQPAALVGPPLELFPDDCALLLALKARRRLFDLDPAKLSAIDLRWPGGRLRFERREASWYAGSRRLEPARVSRMVRWIGALEGKYVRAYRARSKQGRWTVTVELSHGRRQSCSFDATGAAWCAGRQVVYQLPERLIRGFPSAGRGTAQTATTSP